MPQTGGSSHRHLSLTVAESGSPRSGCRQAQFLPRALLLVWRRQPSPHPRGSGERGEHSCLQGHGPSRGSSFTTIQAPRPPNTVALGARLSAQTGHGLGLHPRQGHPFGRPPSLPLRSQQHSASPPIPGLPRASSMAHGPASPILSLSLYILPHHSDWRLSPMSASPMGTARVVPGPLGKAEKVPRTFAESHFALI